jgi:hypothetical protein
VLLNKTMKPNSIYDNDFVKYCRTGDFNGIQQYLPPTNSSQDILLCECGFTVLCTNNMLNIAKWLLKMKPQINVSNYLHLIFKSACIDGYLEIAKFAYELDTSGTSINITHNDNYIFYTACKYKRTEIVKFLISIETIDITAHNNCAFYYACVNNDFELINFFLLLKPINEIFTDCNSIFGDVCASGLCEMAQYLIKLNSNIDITSNNHYAFTNACNNNHWQVVCYLMLLKPELYYACLDETNKIISYDITKILIIDNYNIFPYDMDDSICVICYKSKSNIKTKCEHLFCHDCLKIWYLKNNSCPCCRKTIID